MRCILGFDGGGTKTECVAMDFSGNILARGRGPASNPTRIGFEPAAAGVKQAADNTLATLPQACEIAYLCAGLAGTAKPENRERMLRLLEQKFPGVPIDLRTDLDLPLSTMPDGPAIVLVVGTGSAAIGRDAAGKQLREGGYGPSGSDEGSAFDIGRSAVAAVRQQHDSDAASKLSRQILRHLGCPNWHDADARVATNPDEVYPRVFPVVAASADAGNSLAQSLLQDAALKLAAMALRLAESLDIVQQKFPLAKTGGTVGRSPFFDQALDRELCAALPHAFIVPRPADAAETAARIALRDHLSSAGARR
jgi:glucosamine kinase